MEVAAGAELGEEAEPFGGVNGGVESGQEGVVQQFENFPFCPRPPFLAPARKLLLVHHLRREGHGGGGIVGVCGLEFGEVDGADVA